MNLPKIKIPEDCSGVEVLEKGAGDWEILSLNYHYCFALVGWGGEEQITIFMVPRQDGNTHILVVHSKCDGDSTTKEALVEWKLESDTVNELIAEILRR